MVRKALVAAIACAIAAAPDRGVAAPSTGVPVFMYHRIDRSVPTEEIGRELTIDPAVFERELRRLHDAHVETITANDLVEDLAHGKLPQHTVVLTFDDGYSDAATEVFPRLRKYGMRATFYVVTGTIGTPHHLTWRDIRAMQHDGMEIGAHGAEHLDLSTLTSAEQQEIAGSCVRSISRWTATKPTTYAYPSGQYDAATLAVMRGLGMRAAFTTQPGVVRSLASPYTLPRVRLNRRDADDVFAAYAAPVIASPWSRLVTRSPERVNRRLLQR